MKINILLLFFKNSSGNVKIFFLSYLRANPPGTTAATKNNNPVKAQKVVTAAGASSASTAGPPVTKDKVPKTNAIIAAKEDENIVISDSEVSLKESVGDEKMNADTAATKITAVPKDITVDASANAEITTTENKAEKDTQAVNETESAIKAHEAASSVPTTESKIENKELEVESSVPSSESAVSAESGKAELEVGSSIPASESGKTELEVASAVSASEPAVSVESAEAENELASSETSILIVSTDQTGTSLKKNEKNVLQAEDVPKELVPTSVEEGKIDNSKLEDNNDESKSEMEIVASTVSSEETAVEAMETQSPEELSKSTDVKDVLETHKLKIEIEGQTNDLKPTEPLEMDINPQSSNENEPAEEHVPATVESDSDLPSTSDQTVSNSSVTVTCASNSPQTVLEPFQIDESSLDFPPVTQEILKALELAVHQCRLQSSLKRAEEAAKQRAEMEKKAAEKKPTKGPSSSKKPAQATKKTTQAESKKIQAEKERKSQNAGSKSKPADTSSPEKEPTSRHRSRGNSEEDGPTTRRGGSCGSSSSRRSRRESTPPSKRFRGHDVDHRVRCTKFI